jgi:hypothetical protein
MSTVTESLHIENAPADRKTFSLSSKLSKRVIGGFVSLLDME